MTTPEQAAEAWKLVADEIGCYAYTEYCAAVGGKSVAGDPLPDWTTQCRDKPAVAQAWRRAAFAAVQMKSRLDTLREAGRL